MDAEAKELLREWLTRSLEPVCDADPQVLSKYVLALLQNNPQKEGLRDVCISKLEEFLGDETTGFVDRLFKAIKTGSYRNSQDEADDRIDERVHGDQSRRRTRPSSDDEDDRRGFNKRRRDDDRTVRDGSRRDGNGRRQQQSGGRGGLMNGREYGNDRRRNFPPEWGMPPQQMGMWPPHFPPPRGGFPMGDFDPNMYNPENPSMMPHQMGMMMPGRHPFYPQSGGRQGGRGGYFAGRGNGSYGNGAKDDDASSGGAKTTLRVSNVDPKYVNMTKLSLHFSKFGNVVNVQMRPSFKCAYVQYATEDEAKKAYHSPIPVCNNRFIEVKWAKYDAKDPEGAPSIAEQSAAEGKEQDGTTSVEGHASSADAAEGNEVMPEKEMTPEELRAAALKKGRKVLEEKRELLEKQRQLMKQKEDLIKRQLAQQKIMLERMSQNSAQFSVADKRDLLNKITKLSEELKSLQPRPLALAAASVPAAASSQENGNDLNGLKAELSALEAQASPAAGGRGPGRGFGGRWGAPGRGYYRGGGRGGRGRGGFARYSNTLDNRTTIVKVENLPEEARDPSVLEQHFGNFGVVERVALDESSPGNGFIKFQDRYAGQTALSHGALYGTTSLQMKWVEAQDAPAVLTKSSEPSAEISVKSEEVPTGA